MRQWSRKGRDMTIHLKPDQEQRITEALGTGAYESPDEVIARALEMLRERDEWLSANRKPIEAKILRGMEELDRGEGIPEDELDAHLERLKSETSLYPRAAGGARFGGDLAVYQERSRPGDRRQCTGNYTRQDCVSLGGPRCRTQAARAARPYFRRCQVLRGVFIFDRLPARPATAGRKHSTWQPGPGTDSRSEAIRVTQSAWGRAVR